MPLSIVISRKWKYVWIGLDLPGYIGEFELVDDH
jgi:hypothetical protein